MRKRLQRREVVVDLLIHHEGDDSRDANGDVEEEHLLPEVGDVHPHHTQHHQQGLGWGGSRPIELRVTRPFSHRRPWSKVVDQNPIAVISQIPKECPSQN